MGKGNGSAGRADKQSKGVKEAKSATDSKKYANTLDNLRNEFEHVNYGNRGDLLILRKLGDASFKQMNEDMQDALSSYNMKLNPEELRLRRSSASVDYSLIDKDGYVVGNMTRRYIIKDGKKIVEHQLLTIDPTIQGKDIGKRLLKAQLDFAQKAGMDEIRVHANIDRGGYAWARYGFKMDKLDAQGIVHTVERRLGDKHPATQAFKTAVNSTKGDYVHIKPVVDKYREDMKSALKGVDWQGVINLRNKNNLAEYSGYLSGTKRDIGATEGQKKKRR